MAYAPSPRPTYDAPTHIPYGQVTRHLWGEPEAGEVADWIYASTQDIHQIVFGLAPGGSFRHSDSFRTIFAADELLYVLNGTMVISNPQTGEVHRVQAGESVFFRRDTWHHAYNYGSELLQVLEYFSPPPSQGTSGSYAQKQPFLTESRYAQTEYMGKIPMQNAEIRRSQTMQVIRETDYQWQLARDTSTAAHPMLVGLLAATEHLTVGKGYLLPGQKSPLHTHVGAESLFLLKGRLNVYAPEGKGQSWFELNPMDGFYVTPGSPHQYFNMTGEPVEFVFGVAPDYAAVDTPSNNEADNA